MITEIKRLTATTYHFFNQNLPFSILVEHTCNARNMPKNCIERATNIRSTSIYLMIEFNIHSLNNSDFSIIYTIKVINLKHKEFRCYNKTFWQIWYDFTQISIYIILLLVNAENIKQFFYFSVECSSCVVGLN